MTVHGNGDLPEGEGAGINVAERLLTLLLDGVLEGADRLCIVILTGNTSLTSSSNTQQLSCQSWSVADMKYCSV